MPLGIHTNIKVLESIHNLYFCVCLHDSPYTYLYDTDTFITLQGWRDGGRMLGGGGGARATGIQTVAMRCV